MRRRCAPRLALQSCFLKKIDRPRVLFAMEEWPEFIGAAVEGAMLADYRFEKFKTSRAPVIDSLALQVLPKISRREKSLCPRASNR
jgi:hypothetical protein